MSVGTVWNICKLFEETGFVEPTSNHHHGNKILSEYDELIDLLLASPTLIVPE